MQSSTRVSALGGSLDVAPTILGMLGRPYETMFFGRDLLRELRACAVFIQSRHRYVQPQTIVVWARNRTSSFMKAIPSGRKSPDEVTYSAELNWRDTIALYQVADDLYVNRHYRIDANGEMPRKSTR